MEKLGFKRALVKIRSPPLFKIRTSRNFHEIGTLGFLSRELLENFSPNNKQATKQQKDNWINRQAIQHKQTDKPST